MSDVQYRAVPAAVADGDIVLPLAGSKGELKALTIDANGNTSVGAVAYTPANVASAAGSSETILAASTTRSFVAIANPHATNSWWINDTGGTAVANGAGCWELAPGDRWVPARPPTNIVKGIATAGTPLTVSVG